MQLRPFLPSLFLAAIAFAALVRLYPAITDQIIDTGLSSAALDEHPGKFWFVIIATIAGFIVTTGFSIITFLKARRDTKSARRRLEIEMMSTPVPRTRHRKPSGEEGPKA